MRRDPDDQAPGGTDGPGPELLRGYRHAGLRLEEVLRDATRRLVGAPECACGSATKFADIRMHTQYRRDYAEPQEKDRILQAADGVLRACAERTDADGVQRFDEALAVLRAEGERIFVVTLLGCSWDLVYWNWEYGYTIDAANRCSGRGAFRRDVTYRRVASPALAVRRYGAAVLGVGTDNRG